VQAVTRSERYDRINRVRDAIAYLKLSRDLLRSAKANRAADYVARSLKSAEGALRHARNKEITE
jgi:hypothetical protein